MKDKSGELLGILLDKKEKCYKAIQDKRIMQILMR